MKKVFFVLLILLVMITASCSISAGIPWLFGGWGFFADFGIDFGILNLEQKGADLTGVLETESEIYFVKGEYQENGEIIFELSQEDETLHLLKGSVNVEEGQITGTDWYAVKEQ